MKPCKYCNGTKEQGIGQDYCECVECGGTGVDSSKAFTVVCAVVLVGIVGLSIFLEVMK